MSYNPDVQLIDQPQGRHRCSIRLKEYNYGQSGAYFITIVTHERAPLFGAIEKNAMRLSVWGEIARDEWFKTAVLRPYVTLCTDEFVVMPNHAHGIVWINNAVGVAVGTAVGAERRSTPTTNVPRVTVGSLGAVARAYKSAVTYAVNAIRQTRNATVWQRNYYEHIIRNDEDLNRIRDYIANNPVKWMEDELYG